MTNPGKLLQDQANVDLLRERNAELEATLAAVRRMCERNAGWDEQDWTSVVGFAGAILAILDGEEDYRNRIASRSGFAPDEEGGEVSDYDSQEQAIARLRGRAEAAEEELEERHRLEAELAEEREAVKAAERERDQWKARDAWVRKAWLEAEATLAAVREYRDKWAPNSPIYQDLDTLLDGEGKK